MCLLRRLPARVLARPDLCQLLCRSGRDFDRKRVYEAIGQSDPILLWFGLRLLSLSAYHGR